MGATTAATETQAKKGVETLKGDLCQFNLGTDRTNRRYFVVNLPYGKARKIFKAEPYDPSLNRGEQRARIDSHVRKLEKAMMTGEFTPSPWTGGVRDNHMKNLTIDKGKVTLEVNERQPLPLLDGGHRNGAIEAIRSKGDKEMQELVDGITITVLVQLDPTYIKRDFRHLQEGHPVNRSQLAFMKQAEGDVDPKKAPVINVAKMTAWALNKSTDSFLHNEIKFTGSDSGRVEYAAISTLGGSDIGTSVAGGAKIALWQDYKALIPTPEAARDFLLACYDGVYQGIFKYDEKVEVTDEVDGTKTKFPALLLSGRMLRPTILKGTKAGTGLLLMMGNMLAFYMLEVRKKTEIQPADFKKVIEAARTTLDLEMQGGGSGTVKRALTRDFTKELFREVVRKGDGDEHDMKKLGAIGGVPTKLCDLILTRSTMGIGKTEVEYIAADTIEEGEDEGEGEEDGHNGVNMNRLTHRPDPKDTAPDFETSPDFKGDDEEPADEPDGKSGKAKVGRGNKAALGKMG